MMINWLPIIHMKSVIQTVQSSTSKLPLLPLFFREQRAKYLNDRWQCYLLLTVIELDWVIDTIKKLLSVHLFLPFFIWYWVCIDNVKHELPTFFPIVPSHWINNNLSINWWYHIQRNFYLSSVICTHVAVLSSLQWLHDASVWL